METKGTFEVSLKPLDAYATGTEGLQLGRMSIDKTFTSGDLLGSSQGEMLSARTTVEGAAGYVAIEQFSGSLAGKNGSFALQHFGIMNAGEHRLILEVIPASGSGELANISGTMTIDIVEGVHTYTFNYSH